MCLGQGGHLPVKSDFPFSAEAWEVAGDFIVAATTAE